MATTVESLEARVASVAAVLADVERRVAQQPSGSLRDVVEALATLYEVLDGVSTAEIEAIRESVEELFARLEMLRRMLEIVRRTRAT